jgi:hypothetical protein
MEKVVYLFEIIKTIFYFFELGKVLLRSKEVWINLKWFEIV